MTVTIGNAYVGRGQPTFTIAEIGINHNGSIDIALKLIDAAAKAGANAVKFQKRDVPIVYSKDERDTPREFHRSFAQHALERAVIEDVTYPVFPEKGQLERMLAWVGGSNVPTYNGDLKYALEFGPKEWDMIRQRCEDVGVAWGVSAWDGLSVYEIDGFQPDFHKIASACLTHSDLLQRVKRCGRPVILSTGGSSLDQVKKAVNILGRDQLVILHCVATYPSTDEETNIRIMETLRDEFHDVPVGYSGHEADTLASRLAVSRGAIVVERHVTLNRNMPGSDQKASIEPDDLALMIDEIKTIETKRGTRNVLPAPEWASAEEMSRIETILGSGTKKVLEREAATMNKLRRVKDF